jgi:hypothetical protein
VGDAAHNCYHNCPSKSWKTMPTTNFEPVSDRGRLPKTLIQLSSAPSLRTFPEPSTGKRPQVILRKVEREILATPTCLTFCLKFESFHVWLLALESNLVDQEIVILGHKYQTELEIRIQDLGVRAVLLLLALNNIQTSNIRYTNDLLPPPGTSSWLVAHYPSSKSGASKSPTKCWCCVTSTFVSAKRLLMVTCIGI